MPLAHVRVRQEPCLQAVMPGHCFSSSCTRSNSQAVHGTTSSRPSTHPPSLHLNWSIVGLCLLWFQPPCSSVLQQAQRCYLAGFYAVQCWLCSTHGAGQMAVCGAVLVPSSLYETCHHIGAWVLLETRALMNCLGGAPRCGPLAAQLGPCEPSAFLLFPCMEWLALADAYLQDGGQRASAPT